MAALILYNQLCKNGRGLLYSTRLLADQTGYGDRMVRLVMNHFVQAGVVQRVGVGRATRWQLAPVTHSTMVH